MGLFQITNIDNLNDLNSIKLLEGQCYFVKDTGNFYIDIDGDGTTNAELEVNRINLSAYKGDKFKNQKQIILRGDIEGSGYFDGSQNCEIETNFNSSISEFLPQNNGAMELIYNLVWNGIQNTTVEISNLNQFQLLIIKFNSNLSENTGNRDCLDYVNNGSITYTGVIKIVPVINNLIFNVSFAAHDGQTIHPSYIKYQIDTVNNKIKMLGSFSDGSAITDSSGGVFNITQVYSLTI